MKDSSKLPDLEYSRVAIIEAARSAAKLAKEHNRPLILWRDGKVVEVPVDELPPLPDKAPIRGEPLDEQDIH